MLRYVHRSNLNELLYAVAKEFASWRSVHGTRFHPGILSNKLLYFTKYFLISFERIGGGVGILTRAHL